MKHLLCAVTLLALVGSTVSFAGAEQASIHEPFDRVLKETVRGEAVDYRRVRSEHLERLDEYLESMSRVDPLALSRDDRLAFYINLYNATMISAIVERYEPGYSTSDDELRVFKEDLVMLSGKRVSLDHLEHEIIRKGFEEPRIHVALVCGARSCPPLLPRAYEGSDLDQVLEANMRRFINDPSRNLIDPRKKRLTLSRIFDWFADDFGGRDEVARYVARYTDADVSRYSISFLEYSWELNILHR